LKILFVTLFEPFFNYAFELKKQGLPHCDLEFSNGKYVMKSTIEVKMINLIAEKYNFRYEVVFANQSWGTIKNGVWVGSVGFLYNKVVIRK